MGGSSVSPWVFTQGETLEELKQNLYEAVEGWLRTKEENIVVIKTQKSQNWLYK